MKHRLICGDVLDVLPRLNQRFTCLIADPPDNIGLKYGAYYDKRPTEAYGRWLSECLEASVEGADIVWVSFNAKYLLEIGALVSAVTCDGAMKVNDSVWSEYDYRVFIQTFTFGQNNNRDCGNGYRPLLRCVRRGTQLYPDTIKVPSWREQNGDKRAAKGGRVPLDVWDFPRVTGNSKQRRSYHPTQLNENLVDRIIRFSTVPGDTICDAFSGTGTVLRAPSSKDRHVTSIELDPFYCEKIAEEHGLQVETIA